jgi:STE24 endopeptidase
MLRITCLLLLLIPCLAASAPTAPPTPPAARASSQFDPQTATNAWLATFPQANRARSDAYFEGGYWLILWDFLTTALVMIVVLETGLSARMRALAERWAGRPFLQIFLFWTLFQCFSALVLFPWTVYEGYFREHQYGLSNQNFGGWFRDTFVSWLLLLVFGGLFAALLFALIKKLPRTWHLWGAAAGIVFTIFAGMIAPVYIAPLFNTYTPLKDMRLKRKILSLARQNGIPARDVYEVDASRQSKRVSANVSGLFGTERITLNDNLLSRCSPEGVLATMGHEMGHYIMHHIENAMLFFSVVIFIMFQVLRWGLETALARRGEHWGIHAVSDVAVLPLAVLILATLGFLFTPIANTFTRAQEYEADIFGLNSARQPDGEAEVDLLLGEYRKLDPKPWEEILFFDHPAGRTRIYAAMRWKAENLCLFDVRLPCANPAPTVRAEQ